MQKQKQQQQQSTCVWLCVAWWHQQSTCVWHGSIRQCNKSGKKRENAKK